MRLLFHCQCAISRHGTFLSKSANIVLGDKQRRFWQIVAGRQSNGRPAHFTIEHVKQWCAEESSLGYQEDDVQQQLDLLIRLGLIQQVHVKGEAQDGAYDENLYRALTKGDIISEGGA